MYYISFQKRLCGIKLVIWLCERLDQHSLHVLANRPLFFLTGEAISSLGRAALPVPSLQSHIMMDTFNLLKYRFPSNLVHSACDESCISELSRDVARHVGIEVRASVQASELLSNPSLVP